MRDSDGKHLDAVQERPCHVAGEPSGREDFLTFGSDWDHFLKELAVPATSVVDKEEKPDGYCYFIDWTRAEAVPVGAAMTTCR